MQRTFRILIAVDGSDLANKAVDEVTSLAWGRDTEIVLFHAFQTASDYFYGAETEIATVYESRRQELVSTLQQMSEKLGERGLNVTSRVETAPHAGDAICDHAVKIQADIVVVGSHGYTGLKKFLLGSVSQYVLRHVVFRMD